MKLQLRGTAVPHDLDVAPQHAVGVACAERLHAGFLGRESAGEMNRRCAAPGAVGDLALGEDAAEKALAIPLDRVRDAVNLRGVQTEADDVGHD